MQLAGLPEFGAETILAEGPVWRAAGRELWLAPAGRLGLARDAAGGPALRLTLTRPAAPFLPPAPFGALDASFEAGRDLDRALAEMRGRHPGAALAILSPDIARIRLGPAPGAPDLPAGLAAPAEILWQADARGRFLRHLDIDAAGLVAAMLEDGALPLLAHAALGYRGLSPRLPLVAGFDPAELLAALAPAGPVTQAALAARIAAALDTMPLDLPRRPEPAERAALAATLADRLLARFGRPAAGTEEPAHLLPAPGEVAPGRFTWDLAQPVTALRWITLAADPFAALDDAAALVRRVTLPPLPSGARMLDVVANLPAGLAGLQALGATASAPPLPPHRPQPAHASAVIDPATLEARLTLRLSPGEPPDCTVAAFAVLADAAGVRRCEGLPRRVSGGIVTLSPEDFGLAPVVIEAAPALLGHAALTGEARFTLDGRAHAVPLKLDAAAPRIALDLPAAATGAELRLTAVAPGGATLALPPLPLRTLRLDLPLLPGHGPQRAVLLALPQPGTTLAVEVLPDSAPPGTAPETLAFRDDLTRRDWTYLSLSPFAPGFHWRILPDGEWRPHPEPAEVLVIA